MKIKIEKSLNVYRPILIKFIYKNSRNTNMRFNRDPNDISYFYNRFKSNYSYSDQSRCMSFVENHFLPLIVSYYFYDEDDDV